MTTDQRIDDWVNAAVGHSNHRMVSVYRSSLLPLRVTVTEFTPGGVRDAVAINAEQPAKPQRNVAHVPGADVTQTDLLAAALDHWERIHGGDE